MIMRLGIAPLLSLGAILAWAELAAAEPTVRLAGGVTANTVTLGFDGNASTELTRWGRPWGGWYGPRIGWGGYGYRPYIYRPFAYRPFYSYRPYAYYRPYYYGSSFYTPY